jgi:hypothetical protein
MHSIKKSLLLFLVISSITLLANRASSYWTIKFDSHSVKEIIAEQGYSIHRGSVTASKDSEEQKLKFTAATINNEINLLVIKDLDGNTMEPQLSYDSETKEFFHGKRKNKISKEARSDSTNKEIIRSGIEIWLDLE